MEHLADQDNFLIGYCSFFFELSVPYSNSLDFRGWE